MLATAIQPVELASGTLTVPQGQGRPMLHIQQVHMYVLAYPDGKHVEVHKLDKALHVFGPDQSWLLPPCLCVEILLQPVKKGPLVECAAHCLKSTSFVW